MILIEDLVDRISLRFLTKYNRFNDVLSLNQIMCLSSELLKVEEYMLSLYFKRVLEGNKWVLADFAKRSVLNSTSGTLVKSFM